MGNWSSASSYCANLTLGGYIDWRLPAMEELTSIIDISNNNSINPTFVNYINSIYWSSTANDYYAASAWVVSFGNVYNSVSYNKYFSHHVRCVR